MVTRRPPPLDALPPTLRGAVDYASQRAQVPVELALIGALCAFSTVFQGLAKIQDSRGDLHPLSIHGYVGADSGDGKTPCSDILMREIRAFDDDFESARKSIKKRSYATTQQFARDVSALTKEIAKCKAKGKDFTELQEKLDAAMDATEEDPYAPRFVCSDASSASLISTLRYRFPFALLGEDEGSIVLNSGAFENSGLMIKLWDKMQYTYDRANVSIELRAGVTVFAAVQPKLLRDSMASKAGRLAVERGKFARGIWTFPESLQGKRDFGLPLPDETLIAPYHSVLRAALDRFREGLPIHSKLELSDEAGKWLRWYQREIERQLREDGLFNEMRAQANKSALIALRLAALVHMGEGFSGLVSGDTMKVAIRLAAFFLWEYRCYFCPLTQVERHAALLKKACDAYFELNPDCYGLDRRYFLRHADPAIRHVNTLNPAAKHLEKMGFVKLSDIPRGSWTLTIWPDPAYPAHSQTPSGLNPISQGRHWGAVKPEPLKEPQFEETMIWPGIAMPDL